MLTYYILKFDFFLTRRNWIIFFSQPWAIWMSPNGYAGPTSLPMDDGVCVYVCRSGLLCTIAYITSPFSISIWTSIIHIAAIIPWDRPQEMYLPAVECCRWCVGPIPPRYRLIQCPLQFDFCAVHVHFNLELNSNWRKAMNQWCINVRTWFRRSSIYVCAFASHLKSQ